MLISLSVALSALLGGAPLTYTLDSANKVSMVSYTATHKLHKFTGTSHDLQGMARILPDGTVQVQIRGAVGTFDSENGNRDEHMKETVEAVKFPDVTVKCLGKVATPPTSQKFNADCDINLHGQSQKVSTPVDLTIDGKTAKATGAFAVSWEGFGIKRPQLLFVPIQDQGDIVFDVTFRQ